MEAIDELLSRGVGWERVVDAVEIKWRNRRIGKILSFGLRRQRSPSTHFSLQLFNLVLIIRRLYTLEHTSSADERGVFVVVGV